MPILFTHETRAATGWPPPDTLKREHLLALRAERDHRVFVESGTYLGDTVEALRPHVDRVVSVEIEPELHARAVARFASAPGVEILCGDASDHLPRVLAELAQPALVWVDGHFSGGVTGRGVEDEPAVTILTRLASAARPGTTLLVDDLRMFGDDAAWPTLEELVLAARAAFPFAAISAAFDALVVRA